MSLAWDASDHRSGEPAASLSFGSCDALASRSKEPPGIGKTNAQFTQERSGVNIHQGRNGSHQSSVISHQESVQSPVASKKLGETARWEPGSASGQSPVASKKLGETARWEPGSASGQTPVASKKLGETACWEPGSASGQTPVASKKLVVCLPIDDPGRLANHSTEMGWAPK